jgi:F-box associated protein
MSDCILFCIPLEILFHIINNINDFKSYKNLSLTCKYFRGLCFHTNLKNCFIDRMTIELKTLGPKYYYPRPYQIYSTLSCLKNNIKHGMFESRELDSDDIRERMNYNLGKLDGGYWIKRQDNLIIKDYYTDGLKHGLHMEYYQPNPKGNKLIRYSSFYENGKEVGPGTLYVYDENNDSDTKEPLNIIQISKEKYFNSSFRHISAVGSDSFGNKYDFIPFSEYYRKNYLNAVYTPIRHLPLTFNDRKLCINFGKLKN